MNASSVDRLEHQSGGPFLVVGGSGVVGRHFVPLLRAAHPERRVVILARDATRAAPLLERDPKVSFWPLDLTLDEPIVQKGAALITLVNDPSDRLLVAAVRGGMPLVDIARWTSRLTTALTRLAMIGARAPVVFSSGWMGGLAPRIAAALARTLERPPVQVDIAIRYAMADAAGDDSVAYMDRLWIPFESMLDGERRSVTPLSDGRRVDVGGSVTRVYRIDTPEQLTLPHVLGARSVATRIGFDSAFATFGLVALNRLGVFCALSGDRWTPLRRSLLRTQGKGDAAAFRVDAGDGTSHAAVSLVDPAGQAHLTAVGALISLEQALASGTRAGAVYPEEDPDNAALLDAPVLGAHGIALHGLELPERVPRLHAKSA